MSLPKQNIEIQMKYLTMMKALQFGIQYIDRNGIINVRLFKELHKILLQRNVRGKNKALGELRKINNWVGLPGSTIENASHVPPSHIQINDYMKNLEQYINDDTMNEELDPLMKAAIIHV